MIFQSDSVVEGLGDRLDREFLSGVACLVNRTVGGYQADAEPIRVRIRVPGYRLPVHLRNCLAGGGGGR